MLSILPYNSDVSSHMLEKFSYIKKNPYKQVVDSVPQNKN